MKARLFIAGLLFCFSAKVMAQSSIVQMYQSPIKKVDSLPASSQMWMQFPRAFGFDEKKTNGDLARKILLSWAISADHKDTIPRFHHRITPNGGEGYWAKVRDEIQVNFGNALKRRDNTILCMPNVVTRDSVGIVPGVTSERRFEITYHTSTDNGLSFNALSGTVNFPFFVNWVAITRGIFEDDGALYLPAYASYPIYGSHSRCILLKSVNNGQTWSWYSDVTTPTSIADAYFDEVTVAICANGDWLAVFREAQFKPLRYARSVDRGLNWGTPQLLPGLPTTSQTDIDDYNESVDPFLQLMPNGILMLSYGRPNSHMAFSYDGNGTNWSYPMTTFLESPGLWSLAVNGKQSTNYLATVPLGYNRFLQYGDTGADWVYHSATKPNYIPIRHPYPNPFSIWQKTFEMVTNRQNRIDLKKKILDSVVVVMPQTTLNYSDVNHPESRHLGAVDGSVDYWSSAIGTGSGVYQLDLKKKYNINTVGLAMLSGKKQSATIEFSEDLLTWVTVKTYSNETHRSIQYSDITPRLARYVKVTLSGSGQIGIGELELYQTASTFEGNGATPVSTIHGMMPPGYSFYGGSATAHGMSVRDIYGYQSNRALTLYDGSSSYMAGIKKIEAASNKKNLEFMFRAVAIPSAQTITMRILGTVSGVENVVFYVAILSDGSIKANQGTGFTINIAPPNTIERSSTSPWRSIRIEANESANTASFYLDGVLKSNFTMFASPANATNLTGFGFTSHGTTTSGEIAYFDDVNFYNPDAEEPSGVIASTGQSENKLYTDLSGQDKEMPGQFSFLLSPNPAGATVSLTLQNAAKGLYEIDFSDMLGRRVKRLTYNLEGQMTAQDIPIPWLSSGFYIVTVRQGSQLLRKKLIVK